MDSDALRLMSTVLPVFYQRECIAAIGNTIIVALMPYQIEKEFYSLLPIGITYIGDSETFDDSRLTAKMGVSGMRMSCKALIIGHSFAPGRSCCVSGSRKADSRGLCTGKPAQKPCWGSMAPLRRRSRRRRA